MRASAALGRSLLPDDADPHGSFERSLRRSCAEIGREELLARLEQLATHGRPGTHIAELDRDYDRRPSPNDSRTSRQDPNAAGVVDFLSIGGTGQISEARTRAQVTRCTSAACTGSGAHSPRVLLSPNGSAHGRSFLYGPTRWRQVRPARPDRKPATKHLIGERTGD